MATKTPKVAVIMAARNGAQWVREQILSILNQEGVHVELFISVDLSTDRTSEVVSELANTVTNIVVFDSGEVFGSAAKNFYRIMEVVDVTEFDYIALADQDDVWMPGKLLRATSELLRLGADGFSSDMIAFGTSIRETYVKKSFRLRRFDHLFESGGAGCTYVLRAESFEDFQGFLKANVHLVRDVGLHDWLIYAFFRERGYTWIIDNVPLIRYRQHDRNAFGVNSGLRAYVNRFHRVSDGWYKMEVDRICACLGVARPSRFFIIRNFRETRRRFRDAVILLLFVFTGLY